MKKGYDWNRPALRVLGAAYTRRDRIRNRVLMISVGLVVAAILTISCLTMGKIKVDTTRNMRSDGCATTLIYKAATAKQLRSLKRLDYVTATGCATEAGLIYAAGKSPKTYPALATSPQTFARMYAPAYTGMTGHYPVKSDEIMLSRETLKQLGVSRPRVGMRLWLKSEWYNWKIKKLTGRQSFRLAGYYREYAPDAGPAFLSRTRLTAAGVKTSPYDILIQTSAGYMSGQELEDSIYDKVKINGTDSPEMILQSADSALFRAAEGTTGGYIMMYTFAFLLLLALFLLIYNVMLISLSKTMKEYGLLAVIGVTNRQIKRLLYAEMLRIGLGGALLGAAAGPLLALLATKVLLGRALWLWPVLLVLVGFVGLALVIATAVMAGRLNRLTPLGALHFEDDESENPQPGQTRRTYLRGSLIKGLAWRHLTGAKARFVLTVLALFLGCTVTLCAEVVARGMDKQRQLEQNPDFTIAIGDDSVEVLDFADVSEQFKFIDRNILTAIRQTAGVSRSALHVQQGVIAITSDDDKNTNRVMGNLSTGERKYNIILPLSPDELQGLQRYQKKSHAVIDLPQVRTGNGTLIVHDHLMNPAAEKAAKQDIGRPFPTSSMNSKPSFFFGPNESIFKQVILTNAGYLDCTKKHFPDLHLPWQDTHDWVYFLVNQKTFRQYTDNWQKQNLRVSFDVPPGKEPLVRRRLTKWLAKTDDLLRQKLQNDYYEPDHVLTLTSNSDLLRANHQYIVMNRCIMGIISFALLLIGITGLVNTLVTGILARRREMAALGRVGMTRKQLRQSLTWEGRYYFLLLAGLTLTVGNGIILILGKILKETAANFTFYYPWPMLLIILGIFLLLCNLLPGYILNRINTSEDDDCK